MASVPIFYDRVQDLALEWRHRSEPKYAALEDYVHALRGSKEFKPYQRIFMACIEVTPRTKDMCLLLPLYRSGEFDAPTDKYYYCCECKDQPGSLQDHLVNKHRMTVRDFLNNEKYLQCGYGPCFEKEVYYPDDHVIIHKDVIEYRNVPTRRFTKKRPRPTTQSVESSLATAPPSVQPGPSNPTRTQHFECRDCRFVYEKEECYLNHVKEMHTENKVLCFFCKQGFASDRQRAVHTITVHKTRLRAARDDGNLTPSPLPAEHDDKIKDGGYQCGRCSKFVKDKKQLKRHKKYAHPPKHHHCTECLKSFSSNKVLVMHKAHEHKITGLFAKEVELVDLV